jgi:hypothetical protein
MWPNGLARLSRRRGFFVMTGLGRLSRLAFPVLGPGRLCLAVVLEVVAEDLLEEYRESSNSSVIDALYFVADQVLGPVAQGYHQFSQGRLVMPLPAG